MRIFTLEYEYWDDYQYYQFQHDTKSKEDFENDVNYLIKHYGEEYIDGECHWVGMPGWIEFVAGKLPELGYDKVEVDVVSFSGGSIINPFMSNSDVLWKDFVGAELFSKAVDKNRQLKEDMDTNRQKRNK